MTSRTLAGLLALVVVVVAVLAGLRVDVPAVLEHALTLLAGAVAGVEMPRTLARARAQHPARYTYPAQGQA